MSSTPTNPNQSDPFARRERRGGTTVRLGDGAAAGSAAAELATMMDPATKSLAEALRFSYVLLQIAIVVLVGLFLFSGVQSVGESERGIKVRLGRAVDRSLAPGAHFSLPAPLGDIVRVDVGERVLDLGKAFLPNLSDQEMQQLAANGPTILAGGGSDALDPNVDGQLLTADGAIVHSSWTVTYRHDEEEILKNVENIANEATERAMVLACVKQAIVRAAASVTLDEFMRNTADPGRNPDTFKSVETLARQTAQDLLNRLGAGILIQQLALTQKFPPRRVMPSYDSVQSAQSTAASQIEEAGRERTERLQAAAGDAAEVLLAQIDRYELELARDEAEAAEATLERMHRLMQGESVELDGETLTARVSGEVTALLDEARQERTAMVARAKGDAELFVAKLAAYKTNPLVLINTDWADAYQAFVSRRDTQTMLLPPSGPWIITLNRDPELSREQEMARYGEQFEKAADERTRNLLRARHEERIQTGTTFRQ